MAFSDLDLLIVHATDPTRGLRFSCAIISPDNTRIVTVPDANLTVVGTDTVQVLTGKSIDASQLTGLIATARLGDAAADATKFLRGDQQWALLPVVTPGEVNTTSNVGVGGVGVVLPKQGTDLPFKSINAGSLKITVLDDPTNSRINIGFGIVSASDLSNGITGVGPVVLRRNPTLSNDANGTCLTFGGPAGVNFLRIDSGISSQAPIIRALGQDGTININMIPKDVVAGRLQVNGDNVPTVASVDVLTNKVFKADSTEIIDPADDTRRVKFSCALVVGNRTMTFPDADGTLVLITATQTLTNKTLTAPVLTTPVLGVASATSLATSAASPFLLTNGQLVTIALTSQTVGGATLTIPNFANVSDTIMTLVLAQTITGVKTLGTTTPIQFTDANAYIKATASGALALQGATSTTVGAAGNITVGGGSTFTIQIGTTNTQSIGVFAATPIVRTTAYTQTYATADRTHANLTSEAAAGTATLAGYGCVSAAEFNTVISNITALRNDLIDLKQLVNSVVDDQQAYGWFQ